MAANFLEHSFREGPKGSPQKGYPWSGRFLEISLRNYCIKCPRIREIWPFHGYPFCGYPFWSSSILWCLYTKGVAIHPCLKLVFFFWRGEVGVDRGTGVSRAMRRNLGRDPSKIGSSKSLVLKSFPREGTLWDSSPLVTPHTLGYACTFYAPTSPPPIFEVIKKKTPLKRQCGIS